MPSIGQELAALYSLGNIDSSVADGSVTPAKLSFDPATQVELDAHTSNTANPHVVTKAQVGLGSVDNTADTAKPVSTAQQTAIDAKVQGAIPVPRFATGTYVYLPSGGTPSTNNGLGNGTLRATPFALAYATTFVRLALEVTTAGEAGSKVRLGIYADDGYGRPGALLIDAGQINGDSATAQETAAFTLNLARGVYWAAMVTQGAPTTPPAVRTLTALSGIAVQLVSPNATTIPTGGAVGIGWIDSITIASAATGLPATYTPGTLITSNTARVSAKVG